MLAHGGLIGAAGASAGSVLLVGSNAAPASTQTSPSGAGYFFLNHYSITAAASGTPASISVYIGGNLGASNILMVVYDSNLSLVARTASGAFTTNAWNTRAVQGTPSNIVSGNRYYIGVQVDGYLYLGVNSSAWSMRQVSGTYGTVPDPIDVGSQQNYGAPCAYVMS